MIRIPIYIIDFLMLKGKLIITKKRLYAAFFFNLFEMKIKLSYNELKLKMQYYCSYLERCDNEGLKKLKTYHVASDEKYNIISDPTISHLHRQYPRCIDYNVEVYQDILWQQ